MQLRTFLVPLLAALPCSCASTGSSDAEFDSGRSQTQNAPALNSTAESDATEQGSEQADTSGMDGASASEASAPAPASLAQDQGSLADDVVRAQRQAQQGKFLSGEYVKDGDRLLDQGDLVGALKAFASAVETDPSNQEARGKQRKVASLMGDDYAGASELLQDATDREMVRRAQARLAAEDARLRAKNALAAGDYDAAIEGYRQAEMILRYNPMIATNDMDAKLVGGELETAIRLADESRSEEERRALEAASAARERREREEATYRENKLRTLYSEANSAFLNQNYDRAEALTTQILVEDPSNKTALELRQVSRDARHAKVDEESRQHYREQWKRTFDEIEMMGVIQTEPVVFDDLKRWADVSKRTPLEFSTLDPVQQADKQAVLERLDAARITPTFVTEDGSGSSLEDIAKYLQTVTGVNFMISSKVASELDEDQKTIKLVLPERSVRKVLDLIAETSESLRWKIEDGVVKFVTKEEMLGGQVLRTYEVRDLIHAIPDFPGREMNVSPSGGTNLAEEDAVVRESNVITGDALEALIRNNVSAASWEADPRNALRISNGTMVVHQTPEVHDQVSKLLDDLREATGIMVDIQARFLKVQDTFLEDIGVDFRGLGQPGLGTNAFFNDFGDSSAQQDLGREIGQGNDLGAFYDRSSNQEMRARVEQLYDSTLGDENVLTGSGGLSFQWTYLNDLQLQMILRAVSKSERTELVTSPRITVHNTARGNLSVVNNVAYVQDFNVEIAQAASIADPVVAIVQDGVVLDVRPVVSADRRFITLELRPTIATLKRPIREVVTTLGSQNSVTIQLPEVEYQRVRTSIPMPDGGTVLLGGLKVSDKQEQNSGVPILNKIPVVSFLFDRKGNYVSNRKLLILLNATIVIPQEHEPTPAQISPTLPPSSAPQTP